MRGFLPAEALWCSVSTTDTDAFADQSQTDHNKHTWPRGQSYCMLHRSKLKVKTEGQKFVSQRQSYKKGNKATTEKILTGYLQTPPKTKQKKSVNIQEVFLIILLAWKREFGSYVIDLNL